MKRIVTMLIALMLLCSVFACAEEAVTLQGWLDAQGDCGEFELTVTVEEILNPVLALVTDGTASVNLFGVMVDGEFTDFITLELQPGDTLVLSNPVYNEYEGTIELTESTLIERIPAETAEVSE